MVDLNEQLEAERENIEHTLDHLRQRTVFKWLAEWLKK